MASQLVEEVTAHTQSDGLKDARELCADGTYFLNNLRIIHGLSSYMFRPPIVTIFREMLLNAVLHRTSNNIKILHVKF